MDGVSKKKNFWQAARDAYGTTAWFSDYQNADAYFCKAYCESKLHQNNLAIKDYSSALSLDRSNACLYNNRASVYTTIGNTDLALADYDKCVTFLPKHSEHFFGRAKLLKDKGRYPRSFKRFCYGRIFRNPKY